MKQILSNALSFAKDNDCTLTEALLATMISRQEELLVNLEEAGIGYLLCRIDDALRLDDGGTTTAEILNDIRVDTKHIG